MTQSYIITTKNKRDALELTVSKNSSSQVNLLTFNDFSIAVLDNQFSSFEDVFVEYEGGYIGVIGKIANNHSLLKLVQSTEKDTSPRNATKLFIALYKKFGAKAFHYIDGCFSVIHFEKGGGLSVFSSLIPNYPTYYYNKDNNFWISNEVKLLRGIKSLDMTLKGFDLFRPDLETSDYCKVFKYVEKMPCGAVLDCHVDGKNLGVATKSRGYKKKEFKTQKAINKNECISALDNLFVESIENYMALDSSNHLAVSLSGGIDSCLAAAYARKINLHAKIRTFTFGSNVANEFNYAQLCADYIGAEHQEILFDEEQFLEGLKKIVYFNEIFNGVFAELHATMYLVYQEACKYSTVLLTGFNADSLFGGLLSLETPPHMINNTLISKLNKTQWTGEYNSYLANSYELHECSPYLNPLIVSLACELDPSFKIYNNEVKYVLKLLADEKSFLPQENIWRKKVRLEEGSAIEQMFSNFLKINPGLYRKKHEYVYNLFKLIFELNVDLKDIDMRRLRDKLI